MYKLTQNYADIEIYKAYVLCNTPADFLSARSCRFQIAYYSVVR